MKPQFHRYNRPMFMKLTDHIYVYLNEEQGSQKYNEILEKFNKELKYIKEDVEKISRFLDFDVHLTIDYEKPHNPQNELEKADGYIEVDGDGDKPSQYYIQIYKNHMSAINHELLHAVDKIQTKDRLSSKPEFKPLIKEYQKFLKDSIKENNKESRLYKHVKQRPYSNGTHQSELFVRLMDHWLHTKYGLNTNTFYSSPFDYAVTTYYKRGQTCNKRLFGEPFCRQIKHRSRQIKHRRTRNHERSRF